MKWNEGLIVSLLKVCGEVEREFVSVYEDGSLKGQIGLPLM
jgi:hypothetical protein